MTKPQLTCLLVTLLTVGIHQVPIHKKENIIHVFSESFRGTGWFPDRYYNRLCNDVCPADHAPLLCSITMHHLVREKLNEMFDQDIIIHWLGQLPCLFLEGKWQIACMPWSQWLECSCPMWSLSYPDCGGIYLWLNRINQVYKPRWYLMLFCAVLDHVLDLIPDSIQLTI